MSNENIKNDNTGLFSKRYRLFRNKALKRDRSLIDSLYKSDDKFHLPVELPEIESLTIDGKGALRDLENMVRFFPVTVPVVIHFKCKNELSEEEQNKVRTFYSSHFLYEFSDTSRELAKEIFLAFGFLLIGMGIMVFKGLVLDPSSAHPIFGAVAEIFAWAFTWEFVNRLGFNGSALWRRKRKAAQLGTAEIVFEKKTAKHAAKPTENPVKS